VDTNLNKESLKFKEYFHTILNNRVENFIDELNKNYKTYLFSGILRNYFLHIYEYPRDLDIIIHKNQNSNLITSLLNKYGVYKINSFGGYKLYIDDLPIDIWFAEDTWAIKNNIIDTRKFKSIEEAVLHSTFFNFSSILYDLNNNQFIYNSIFLNFLQNQEIDFVLVKNPSMILCIINIVYYAEKYRLNISNNAKSYFIQNLVKFDEMEIYNVQYKHFGKIIYNINELYKFKSIIEQSLITH
jgi:hypothetical protein